MSSSSLPSLLTMPLPLPLSHTPPSTPQEPTSSSPLPVSSEKRKRRANVKTTTTTATTVAATTSTLVAKKVPTTKLGWYRADQKRPKTASEQKKKLEHRRQSNKDAVKRFRDRTKSDHMHLREEHTKLSCKHILTLELVTNLTVQVELLTSILIQFGIEIPTPVSFAAPPPPLPPTEIATVMTPIESSPSSPLPTISSFVS